MGHRITVESDVVRSDVISNRCGDSIEVRLGMCIITTDNGLGPSQCDGPVDEVWNCGHLASWEMIHGKKNQEQLSHGTLLLQYRRTVVPDLLSATVSHHRSFSMITGRITTDEKTKLLYSNENVKSSSIRDRTLIQSLAMLKRQACQLTRARMARNVEDRK